MTDQRPEGDGLIPSELARDDAAFADLVEEFLGGLPARLEQLDTALAQNDFGSLRRYAVSSQSTEPTYPRTGR